jgi:hypothetical protein
VKSILSIDGGGMKGYIPCAVLVELEQRAGKPCAEIFDLIAGTSIGGILACLLASGKSAAEALQFFTEDGPRIFGNGQVLGNDGLIQPRYAAGPIENCLMDRLDTATLGHCRTALMVPAFDLVAYEPYFFKSHNYDRPHLLWQVARATSAAQSYFPAFELGDQILWDGGNVCNNPAACAVAEASRIYGRAEPVRVLSLGCGAAASKFEAKSLINAGLAKVGIETLGMLFDANDELPDYLLRQILPDNHFRIQPRLQRALAIDGASDADLEALESEASACVNASFGVLDEFLAVVGEEVQRLR